MRKSTRRVKSNANSKDAVKKSKLERTDLISDLPDDCLLGIFSQLNHDDVDEMSVVSKRMHSVTLAAERNGCRGQKLPAFQVSVVQVNSRKFDFTFTIEDRKWEIKRTVRSTLPNISDRLTKLDRQVNFKNANSKADVDNILIILNRYQFNSYEFNKITLDEDFVNFFVKVTSSNVIRRIGCSVVRVEDNQTEETKQSFLSKILAIMPTSFIFDSNDSFIDTNFLRIFALTTPGKILVDYSDRTSSLHCDDESAKVITNYKYFRVNKLIISTDLLCELISIRLMMEEAGNWFFHINRNISDEEIQAFVQGKNFLFEPGVNSREREIISTSNTRGFKAIFCTRPSRLMINNAPTYTIFCHFIFPDEYI